MDFIDQRVHGIGNPRADCLRACLAMITRIPYDNVIDVTEPDIETRWNVELSDWLSSKGWMMYTCKIPGLRYCIAVGPTFYREGLHAVLWRHARMVHDPHPSRDGLESVKYYIRMTKRKPTVEHSPLD